MTPEWDDEVIERQSTPEEYSAFTYPGSSGSFSSSFASTTAYYPGSINVSQNWGFIVSHITIKPDSTLNVPVLEWDLSGASWGLTIKVILGIILSPILCLISKIAKKPIGLK